MAVVPCIECKTEVSTQAIACPHCGALVGYKGGTPKRKDMPTDASVIRRTAELAPTIPPVGPATKPPPTNITMDVCCALQDLGIDARISDLESDTIGIAEGPIRFVFVYTFEDEVKEYVITCSVPDSRIGPDFELVGIRSVRVKSFPLFGKVKGVRWGGWFGEGVGSVIADHLSKDKTIVEAITNAGIDVEISADGGEGSWEMENEMTEGELAKWIRASRLGPTWDC